jgi:hypothetical protein
MTITEQEVLVHNLEFTKWVYAIDKSLKGDLLRGGENRCRNGEGV